MTLEVSPESALNRRLLLRGGAVLAGVAGATVVGAALAPTADAADGQFMAVGMPNTAESSTVLTENGSAPTLSLENSAGPTLKLSPVGNEWDGRLAVGEVANTRGGPLIGVDYGYGVETTNLVTGRDLYDQPATFAIYPSRYLDTRNPDTRDSVVGSSTSPFDSKGQLRAGQWIDVGIAPAQVGQLLGASTSPPSSQRPAASSPSTRPTLPSPRPPQ